MGRLTADALAGSRDLRRKEIQLESLGGSIVVQGLSAAFSNEAQSRALEMKTVGSQQIASVNTRILEEVQLRHGIVEPQLTDDQVTEFIENNGPTVREIVKVIDELSGVDKDSIDEANARFQGSGEPQADSGEAGLHGSPAGSNGSPVPARAGA